MGRMYFLSQVLAAQGGHLQVLKWAHGNGCPWNQSTSFHADDGARDDMVG
jgi:hypothetical protein